MTETTYQARAADLQYGWGFFEKIATLFVISLVLTNTTSGEEIIPPLATPDPASIPYPGGHPPSQQEIDLGRLLFFDKRLSKNQRVSCSTCHNPDFGFSDGLTTGFGTHDDRLRRNSPSLYNLAWSKVFFLDGRASSLEQQALMPIQNPEEMDMTVLDLVKRLSEVPYYSQQFAKIYPGKGVQQTTIASAIASFERTLISRRSAFDRYLAGDKQAMSPEQIHGMELFMDKNRTNCMACHNGPNFTDDKFHNLGLPAVPEHPAVDLGRWEISQEDPANRGAFKTPGLRNVSLTAPYMHDGSLGTLEQVIVFYNGVEGQPRPAGTDTKMRPDLDLGPSEVRDLVTFLSALTDPVTVTRPTVP